MPESRFRKPLSEREFRNLTVEDGFGDAGAIETKPAQFVPDLQMLIGDWPNGTSANHCDGKGQ
jgi:hypothetical protein